MAGVAGTILAAYAAMGIRIDYLLAASFMSAPGGLLMAKIIMPDPRRSRRFRAIDADRRDLPVADATHERGGARQRHHGRRAGRADRRAAGGAVGAMVLAFVALVALANGLLAGVGRWFGIGDLSFQRLLGYALRAGDVAAQHAVARGGDRRRPVRREDRAQRVRRLYRARRRQDAVAAHRRASSPSRCAASPILARSRSRWR